MIKNVLLFLLGTSVGACSSLVLFAVLHANREDNQKAELQAKTSQATKQKNKKLSK